MHRCSGKEANRTREKNEIKGHRYAGRTKSEKTSETKAVTKTDRPRMGDRE